MRNLSCVDRKELGSLLKVARKSAGLSLAAVASALGFSGNVIPARWENGSREPDASTLARLADLYGVSVDALLGRPSPAPPSAPLPTPEREDAPAPAQEPTSASPALTLSGGVERPAWIDDLRASVTEVSRETSAAILHQEERFVASMEIIGEQLQRRDARQEERDRRQESRDERQTAVMEGLLSVLQDNRTHLGASEKALNVNSEALNASMLALARAMDVIAKQEEMLRRFAVTDSLDDEEPVVRMSTDAESVAQWDGRRGPRVQGRIASEGGGASA